MKKENEIELDERFDIETKPYNYMDGSSETVFLVLDNGKMVGGEFKTYKGAKEYAEKLGR